MNKKILTTVMLVFVLVTMPVKSAHATSPAAGVEEEWSDVDRKLDAVSSGKTEENIRIITGREMEIPELTLQKLRGKNAALVVYVGDGIAVSVTGKALGAVERPLKITFTDIEESIPENAGKAILSEALFSKMFAMEEKTGYSIPLNIHFGLGEQYAGKYANLYHYDEESEKMICDGSFVITSEGRAMFYLGRGDEYILTVTESLPTGGKLAHTVVPGDCLIKIIKRYGITPEELAYANPDIKDARKIRPGQIINIMRLY